MMEDPEDFGSGYCDFGDDGGGGGGFRGGGGGGGGRGGPWRGGRGGGGRGHFDNGFGPRGPPPRFGGSPRRGFGGGLPPNMMRGSPPGRGGFRGPPPGHFERHPFRFQGPPGGGGGWNNGPNPFQMGPPPGGTDPGGPGPGGGSVATPVPPPNVGGSDSPADSQIIWAETKTDSGAVYYYNTKSRVTSWDRPEGPNVTIMSHEEYTAMLKSGKMEKSKGPASGSEGGINSNQPNSATPVHDQSPGTGKSAPDGLGQPPMSVPPMSQAPPGMPNIPGFPVPPPFAGHMGNPPPFAPMQFPMVPPPWGPVPAVPAPLDPIVMQHIDPAVIGRAAEWTEHISPEGKPYYYNSKSQMSVWEKPPPILEFETAKIIAQQRIAQQAALLAAKEKVQEAKDRSAESHKDKEAEFKRATSNVDKGKPVSSTPVSGTPWCVVWTGDKKVFFYNPSTKSSVWERPPELIGRMDVEELLRNCPAKPTPPPPVKKVEATSTSESNSGNQNDTSGATSPSSNEEKSSSKRSNDQKDGEPSEKKAKTDADQEVEKDVMAQEEKDALKEANVMEMEAQAARERATVPLEARLRQFKDMMVEKQVSAFSTWEKELHKIVFDARYLLLTSKERKSAFEEFVKERATEERKEKKARLAQVKEEFMKFLDDVHVHAKMTYNELSAKYSRDERYKMVEKSRDREAYFQEYLAELKRKEKDNKKLEKEKVKERFIDTLQETVTDYHVRWDEVKKLFEGSKFEFLSPGEKEELFRKFQKRLKGEMKRKARKKKRKRKHRDSEKLREEDEVDDEGEPIESDKSQDQSDEDDVNVVSDDDEGVISDDSQDEERIRREKAEISIREREKEVQRALATHLRDRDKERDFYRHEEAVQEFLAIMADMVKVSEMSWRDARRMLKKDKRWDSVVVLSKEKMQELFHQHCDHIEKKKKMRFRDLLRDARVRLDSSWKEVRRKIRDDPRYHKFSTDDRRCEREFASYLKDLATSMKADFRMLLKETKMLNYKTKQHIRENPPLMRDIEAVLEKDKRYLSLDCMPDERHRMLGEYLEELERKGPPPPPTASDKVSRRPKQT